jgi:hypothetical protein
MVVLNLNEVVSVLLVVATVGVLVLAIKAAQAATRRAGQDEQWRPGQEPVTISYH